MENAYARREVPKVCDECSSPKVALTTNAALYGARALDPELRVYGCMKCRASVGVHPGTNFPMGLMACAPTRALRSRAHLEFDALWKHGRLTRTQAYQMMRDELGLEADQAHMAMMTREQLQRVIEWARHYQSVEAEIKRRHEDKKHERRIKRAARAAALEAVKRREKRANYSNKYKRYG